MNAGIDRDRWVSDEIQRLWLLMHSWRQLSQQVNSVGLLASYTVKSQIWNLRNSCLLGQLYHRRRTLKNNNNKRTPESWTRCDTYNISSRNIKCVSEARVKPCCGTCVPDDSIASPCYGDILRARSTVCLSPTRPDRIRVHIPWRQGRQFPRKVGDDVHASPHNIVLLPLHDVISHATVVCACESLATGLKYSVLRTAL